MLEIKDLTYEVDDKIILDKFNLSINPGEIHALMGPNGVGKSTLTKLIMKHPAYNKYKGDIIFKHENIKNKTTDELARNGLFLSMQNPLEIDTISNRDYFRAISVTKGRDLVDFINEVKNDIDILGLPTNHLDRSVNLGSSGGEKKKNEMMAILMTRPDMLILDELDSGLDVDALKLITDLIKSLKADNKEMSILIITHYPKILDYLKPDYVHIMNQGKIIKTGDYTLLNKLESEGYNGNFNN